MLGTSIQVLIIIIIKFALCFTVLQISKVIGHAISRQKTQVALQSFILACMEGWTVVMMTKTKFSPTDGLPCFVTHGARHVGHGALLHYEKRFLPFTYGVYVSLHSTSCIIQMFNPSSSS